MTDLGLFEGYGIELEYMIVSEKDLSIQPISDQILTRANGSLVSDFEDGDITWSNELVMHVIELKTTLPAKSLVNLEDSFIRSLGKMKSIVNSLGARLMPTAMHPFMSPHDSQLWPHDCGEIYETYNRIFGCYGHGWRNLQSMHINLPFRNDREFEQLHTAIRFLLPILPSLTASSPVVERHLTGHLDNRLDFYQQNQKRIPSIAGLIVPEYCSSIENYHRIILDKIYSDISPHDPGQLLRHDWLNSRGAIARFGRKSIEIRVLDLQENPVADLAVADFICHILKLLVNESLVPRSVQRAFITSDLKSIFDRSSRKGGNALIGNNEYASAWNPTFRDRNISARVLWEYIFESSSAAQVLSQRHAKIIENILDAGTLSERIENSLAAGIPTEEVYRRLCDCLDQLNFFEAIK